MVGYLSPTRTEEDNNSNTVTAKNGPETKPKSSIDSNPSENFDFDHWASEADELALPLADSFLDFESIKEWMEEMQVPESCQPKQQAEACLVTGVFEGQGYGNDAVGVVNDAMVAGDVCRMPGGNSVPGHCQGGKAEQTEGMNEVKAGCNGFDNILVVPINDPCDATLASAPRRTDELQGLSSAVEDGMGKVSLTDDVEKSEHGNESKVSFNEPLNPAGVELGDESVKVSVAHGLENSSAEENCKKESNSEDEDDSESSDSSAESSSSSSASSSSSSSDDSSDDEEATKETKRRNNELLVKTEPEVLNDPDDLEEGEILEVDTEKMVSGSHGSDTDNETDMDDAIEDVINEKCFGGDDDDDDDTPKGPIRSKNELSMLPPVPPVDVVLQPSHQMSPVGAIISIMGAQVVVEGCEKHNPLSEGSILWISQTRSALGRVDEIFGPVKNPFYIVRFNSENEVPLSISQGTLVSYVPEFVDHVLNDKSLYQKGYDASGDNDEEVSDEAEFSDDEKEAEYRRMIKQSKRGNNDMSSGDNKQRRGGGKPPVRNAPDRGYSAKHGQEFQPRSETSRESITHGSQPYPFRMNPFSPPGQGAGQPFRQPHQQPPRFAPPNGFGANPAPFKLGNNMTSPSGFQQGNNMAFAGGFPQGSNNMAFSSGFQPGSNEQQMKQPPPSSGPPGQQVRPYTSTQPPFQQPGGHNPNMASSFGQQSPNPNPSLNTPVQPPFQHPTAGHNQNKNTPFGQQGPNPNPTLNPAAQPPFQQPVSHNQNMSMPYGQQGPNANPYTNFNPNQGFNPGQGFSPWAATQPGQNMQNLALSAMLAQQLSAVPGILPLLLNHALLQSGSGGQNSNMQQMSMNFGGGTEAFRPPMFNQGGNNMPSGPGAQNSNMQQQQQMPTNFGGGSEASRPPMFNQANPGGQISFMQQQQMPTSFASGSEASRPPMFHQGGSMPSGSGGQNSNMQHQQQMPTNFTSSNEAFRPPMFNQGVSATCMDGLNASSTPQKSTSFTSSNGEDSPSQGVSSGGGPNGRRPFHNNRGRGGRGRGFRGRGSGGGRKGRNQSR